MIPKDIAVAHALYKAAAKSLVLAIKQEYPVDTIVDATIGRARVRGRVILHGSDWADPETIVIENTATGARRKLCATSEDHRIVIRQLPEPAGAAK